IYSRSGWGGATEHVPGGRYALAPGDVARLEVYTLVPGAQANGPATGAVRFEVVDDPSGAGAALLNLTYDVRGFYSAQDKRDVVVNEGTSATFNLTFTNALGGARTVAYAPVPNTDPVVVPGLGRLSHAPPFLGGASASVPATGSSVEVGNPVAVPNRERPFHYVGMYAVTVDGVTGYLPLNFTVPGRVDLQVPRSPYDVFVPRGANNSHPLTLLNDGNVASGIDVVELANDRPGSLWFTPDRLYLHPGQSGLVTLHVAPPLDAPVSYNATLDLQSVSGNATLRVQVITDPSLFDAIVVSPRGDGQFLTIGAAIAALPAGARIVVLNGTYNERIHIASGSFWQISARDGPNATFLQPPCCSPTIQVSRGHVTIENFTVNRGYDWTQTVYVQSPAHYFTLANSTVNYGYYQGVYAESVHNLTLRNVTLAGRSNGGYGVYLWGVTDGLLDRVGIGPAQYGVFVYGGARSVFREVTTTGTAYGLHLQATHGFVVERSSFSGRTSGESHGARIQDASGFVLEANRFDLHRDAGIRLAGSTGGTLRNNRITRSGRGLDLATSSNRAHYAHAIPDSNTIDGLPVLFVSGQSLATIQDRVTSFLFVYGSNNMTFRNVTLKAAATRLQVVDTENSSFRDFRIEAPSFTVDLQNVEMTEVNGFTQTTPGATMGVTVNGGHAPRLRNLALSTPGNPAVRVESAPLFGLVLDNVRVSRASHGLYAWTGQDHRGFRVESSHFDNVSTAIFLGRASDGWSRTRDHYVGNSTFADVTTGVHLNLAENVGLDNNRLVRVHGEPLQVDYAQVSCWWGCWETLDVKWARHHVQPNNLVDGRPIRYYTGLRDATLLDDAYGYWLVEARNVTLAGAASSHAGPRVLWSDNVTVDDVVLDRPGQVLGVLVESSKSVRVANLTRAHATLDVRRSSAVTLENVHLAGRPGAAYGVAVADSAAVALRNATVRAAADRTAVRFTTTSDVHLLNVDVSGRDGLLLAGVTGGLVENLTANATEAGLWLGLDVN
ncbi:MAG TPA: right-handed parallel beta-helix repeat-containing protein, partial [Candidatus Thermoplasmatota archaeon]|nr:right-handed parallel beta-helix repeat-containing protein [Candidatus Thermoplasmatota archaeon]